MLLLSKRILIFIIVFWWAGVGSPTAFSSDNENQYGIRKSRYQEAEGDLYEGGDNYFVLERRGSTNQASVATVVVRELSDDEDSNLVPAEEGKDFIGETISVTFGPGERSVRVALKIINDTITEAPREHFAILHTLSSAEPFLLLNEVAIIDNDSN